MLPGHRVSPGTQVIPLGQDEVWVQANYKETQTRHMHPGDPAMILLVRNLGTLGKPAHFGSVQPNHRHSSDALFL